MATDRRIGTELAGHRILSVIGRGGMSVVYLAEHLNLERKVALKVLGPELAEDAAFRERFIRESRMAAGLDHPNVVTVYDAGEADDVLYLSMRYIEGSDLERLLRAETRLDPARAIRIVSQPAAALDDAHAAGLVHRDVKPGNILLTFDPRTSTDRAYLSDFGVTKRLHSGAALTRTGQFVGTVDYVAPEQIQSDDVDGRADEYSLACVLFRCLTGSVPFPRDTEVGTIYAHLQEPPPTASDLWAELPIALDAPIERALAKSRDERFATCRAFTDAVAQVVRPAPGEPAPAAPDAPPPEHAPRRRRTTVAVGAVAGVAAIAVVAALLLTSGHAGPGPGPSVAPLPELTWSSASNPKAALDGSNDQEIRDAAEAGGTIVAVGSNQTAFGIDAAVWSSNDGTTWDPVKGEGFGRTGTRRIDGVVVHGQELVAVGWERRSGYSDPEAWRSTDDGASWGRVDPVAGGLHLTRRQGGMHAVASVSGTLVAVGYRRSRGDLDAAVWTSRTGTRWDEPASDSFTGPGDQQMLGVTGLGDRMIAVGSATTASGDLDGAVWIGSRGVWSRVDQIVFGGPGDQQIDAVVAGGPGLVAVGSDTSGGDAETAVWTSSDGSTWRRVPDQPGLDAPGDQIMRAVTRLANGALVAGGSTDSGNGDADGAIWLSGDGMHWSREPAAAAWSGPGEQRIDTLVPLSDGRLLAAGSRGSVSDLQAAVWLATSAFPSASS